MSVISVISGCYRVIHARRLPCTQFMGLSVLDYLVIKKSNNNARITCITSFVTITRRMLICKMNDTWSAYRNGTHGQDLKSVFERLHVSHNFCDSDK